MRNFNYRPTKEDEIYAKRREDVIRKKKLTEAKKSFYKLYKKLW